MTVVFSRVTLRNNKKFSEASFGRYGTISDPDRIRSSVKPGQLSHRGGWIVSARLLSLGLASVGDDDRCIILQVQDSSPTGTCLPVTPECPFPLTAGIAVISALKHWGVLYSARQRFGSALNFGIAATC